MKLERDEDEIMILFESDDGGFQNLRGEEWVS